MVSTGTQGYTTVVRPTLAVDTAIYAALDLIGGQLTLTNAMRENGGSGILNSITITDDDNEKAAFDIVLFDADPGGTTTDNAAWSHASTDPAKIIGRITVAAADYVTMVTGSLAIACLRNIGLPVKNNENTRHLYAVLVATGTPTYTATTDLTIAFGFLQD